MSQDNTDRLKAASEEYRRKVAAGEVEKPEILDPIARAKSKPASLKLAIRAFCYQCMGGDPGWKKDVGNCTAPDCALYPHRPYQNLKTN